jgi:tetratricopeptide (TPR) repeat protein
VLGTYRDTDLDRTHPLAEALNTLRQVADYGRVRLTGLTSNAVGDLLSTLATHDVPQGLAEAISTETDGNPFFIRQVLRHLVEEGQIYQEPDGTWTSDLAVADMGIPEGIREVIGRRLSRLSPDANALLAAAAGFEASFRFDVVAAVAELSEAVALDALDEALTARILEPGGSDDTYAFTHALVRQTVYLEANPSRQVRLHRRIAEALEDSSPGEHAEIASHFHRSSVLPGSERGAAHAERAAAHAETTGAHEEAVAFLRIALDLLPDADLRRPRLLARLATALGWALDFVEAVAVATEAGDAIAAAEGSVAAAEYLAEAANTIDAAGGGASVFLAPQGLGYAGDRRDVTWARLTVLDLLRQEAQDPDNPGIPLDVPERWEAARLLRAAADDPGDVAARFGKAVFADRADALASEDPWVVMAWAGDYVAALPALWRHAEDAVARGRLGLAITSWAYVARCQIALGQLDEARNTLVMVDSLGERWPSAPSWVTVNTIAARDELALATDSGWEELLPLAGPLVGSVDMNLRFVMATIYASMARAAAHLGTAEAALPLLSLVVPALEQAPGWAPNYIRCACDGAAALWLLESTDHVQAVERAVRDKVVAPDFRHPMMDGRLSMARLCGLQGRYDEAVDWFADARRVLDDQGARPLRAITDYDEALMYARRGKPGDVELAWPLVDAAVEQFEEIGMTGWVHRAALLAATLGEHERSAGAEDQHPRV